MSQKAITSQRHNEYVGSDANSGRIPGADKASSGHHYIAIFTKEGAPRQANAERRPEEHLPPFIDRDVPTTGISPDTANQFVERLTTFPPTRSKAPTGQPQLQQPQPLAPAPDSHTVIDRDPYAERTTAADTMTGATSRDVHGGIGKPAAGMSSAQMHHDGTQHRKRNLQGLTQHGNGEELFGGQDAENVRKR